MYTNTDSIFTFGYLKNCARTLPVNGNRFALKIMVSCGRELYHLFVYMHSHAPFNKQCSLN